MFVWLSLRVYSEDGTSPYGPQKAMGCQKYLKKLVSGERIESQQLT